MSSVGVVVTCYERTYREVLRPGHFPGSSPSRISLPFDEVVALVNNVVDRADATERAQALVDGR